MVERSNASPQATEAAQQRYRCVCGVSFEFEAAAGRTCPNCGRHYDPRVFANKFADTMTFAGDSAPSTVPQEQPAPDSLIGTSRGHFRIVSRLGEGGMGAVYQAVDESLQRYVALKVIRQHSAGSSVYEQLVQEARAQARVNHPNVVHIYFVGQTEDSPFFAMELVPGRTLADHLRQGPLPFAKVVRIGLQVASALDRAAQFDIVHGDIKPSNILEADSQTVKISDFGLSRRLSASHVPDRIAGTPNYLSPEVIRGETPDTRSDIYSLGVTLYELTFGRPPFQWSGETLQERLDAHLNQPPMFPEKWPESVPEAWRDVLHRMLAKQPADRYPNYAALIADLVRLMPRRPIPAPRLSRVIAWVIDAGMLTVLQGIVAGPALVLNSLDAAGVMQYWNWLASILGSALSALLLAMTMWIQCRWGATPGKMLFQLGIVDAHGLHPSHRRLSLRVLLQFPWIAVFFSPIFGALGIDAVDGLIALASFLMTMVSGCLVLFRSDQRALHDYLLRTQVVVQAQEGMGT